MSDFLLALTQANRSLSWILPSFYSPMVADLLPELLMSRQQRGYM